MNLSNLNALILNFTSNVHACARKLCKLKKDNQNVCHSHSPITKMNFDDIIYLTLLFCSITFGYYYRTIKDSNLKKNVGTAIGISIVFIVSGINIIHPLVTVIVNSFIILYLSKKQCHLISFAFSFLYLFFFRSTIYFGIPYPPAHTNMIQMILTLKLVGLAFEINSSHNQKDNQGEDPIKVNFMDIFHYSFNYIGVLTGPYYRYRTFKDYFTFSFSHYADWKKATMDKLKFIPLYTVSFLVASYYWPISYATTDEFYERSWLYRYWFIWPNFFIFRMRIYIGLVLSECVCTMAGLGAYPNFTEPKPGQGPSEKLQEMKEFVQKDSDLSTVEYNFDTIHNINPYEADFCTTYREAMKNWNICVQYWLAIVVYKRFPSKKFRTVATVLVSAFWHGVYLGYYVCISTVPFCLALEDVYYRLFLKNKENSKFFGIYKWIHWFFRMHFFSYQAIAFLLLHVNLIWHYYNSIYHAGLILGIVLYVIGLQLLKIQKKKEKKEGYIKKD